MSEYDNVIGYQVVKIRHTDDGGYYDEVIKWIDDGSDHAFKCMMDLAKKIKLRNGVTFYEEILLKEVVNMDGDTGNVYFVKETSYKERKKGERDRDLLSHIFTVPRKEEE